MRAAKWTILLASVLLFSGCQSLMPQWRLFQKKVPAPIVKPAAQVELERQAAEYIARNVEKPVELKPIAVGLSKSLGVPEKPITALPVEAGPDFYDAWMKVLKHEQEQRDELNAMLAKQEGKKIEGTGVNIFGFSVGFAGLALIALLVAFPPLATVLWAIFTRVSGTLSTTAKGIAEFAKENPDAGKKLKEKLAQTQDAVHKQVISKIKAKL